MEPIFKHEIQVTGDMVDGNGHVNNVVYIQWMQDSAIHHAQASGCNDVTSALGATWVARTHRIEYLRPAFAGDAITAVTWVENFRKVRSLRKYVFVRAGDQAVIARAETDWVFIDAKTGKPRTIPDEVKKALPVNEKISDA
jgi:acyl-CoA thioester hydrolase